MNKGGETRDRPEGTLDRRSFLSIVAGCGAAGMAGLQGGCIPTDAEGGETGGPFPVVKIERPRVLDAPPGLISGKDADDLMSDLLARLAGPAEIDAFLRSRFPRGTRVGIKLNCLAGRSLSPRPELVHALVRRLVAAGTDPSKIVLFERTERELAKAGFEIQYGPGLQVLGNDSPGVGYDREPTCFESIGSCFSRILTEKVDGLINFGVLKDHDLAGVSVGLKNLYGLIHNPNKYHENNCSPYVAHVAAAPPVRKKLKLSLCDGLIAQYRGGPAHNPRYAWKAGLVMGSVDPVALDAVGAALIDEKRRAEGMDSLSQSGQEPLYLEEARKLGLGENRLERIKVICTS